MGPVKTSCLGCLITLAHCFRKHDFEVAAVVLLAQVLIKKSLAVFDLVSNPF